MTDQNTAPEWMLAAQNEVAAQMGRLTIDNATLRAQGRAMSAGFENLSAEHSKKLAELETVKAERDRAVAELAEFKAAAPAPSAAIPGAANP